MKKFLIQKRWFRNLFPKNYYYYVDGVWIIQSEFKDGMKLEKVDGPWHSLNFCDCGNELSHSNSYVKSDDNGIWEYKCTHCGKHQYKNGTLGPFILGCNKEGVPLNMVSV